MHWSAWCLRAQENLGDLAGCKHALDQNLSRCPTDIQFRILLSMRHRLSAQFNTKTALLLVIIFQIFALGSRIPGLQNSSLLVDSGSAIIHRQDPYTDWNAYGTIPAIPYWLLSKSVPSNLEPTLFLFLNVLGLAICIRYFIRTQATVLLITLIAVITTGPFRALFASVQHTGVILGCLTLGMIALRQSHERRFPILNVWVGFFLFCVAFDLKPHIACPFILLWLASTKKLRSIFHFGFFYLALRLLIDLWNGRFLERLQFEKWKVWRTDPLVVKEQVSPWKLISFFNTDSQYVFIFSFLVYFLITALIIAKYLKQPDSKYFVYALLLPSITAYLHLYDLILVVAMVVIKLLTSNDKRLMFFAFALLFFPSDYSSPFEITIIFVAILLVIASAQRIPLFKKVIPDLQSGTELLLGFLSSVLFSYFPISLESKVAWQLTFCFFALFVASTRHLRSKSVG